MFYTALIDGSEGAYGVTFPDLPGCTAMGDTVDEAIANAQESLRAWVEATTALGTALPESRTADQLLREPEVRDALSEGAVLSRVLLIRALGRTVKANMTLDSGTLAAIDAAAERLGVSRSALVERMARETLAAYA